MDVSILVVMEVGHKERYSALCCYRINVSILVVMEVGHKDCRFLASRMFEWMFQSLLSWKLVIKMENILANMKTAPVSILVVMEVGHKV